MATGQYRTLPFGPPRGTRHVPAYDGYPLTAPPSVCCGLPGRRGGPLRIVGGIIWRRDCGGCFHPSSGGLDSPPTPASAILRSQRQSNLGFQVGRGLIRPQEKKCEAVRLRAEDRDEDPGTSLLGLAGYYRLPSSLTFSSLAASLTDLTREGGSRRRYQWSSASEEAFQGSRKPSRPSLSSEPQILAATSCCRRMPPTRDWEPSCHRCKKGRSIPPVYQQEADPSREKLRHCGKEALAVKWAVLELRYYLLGRKFTLVTDHAPLQWMARAKTPMPGWLVGSRAPGLPLRCASPRRGRARQRRRSLSDLGNFCRSVRGHSPPTPY